MVSKKMKIKPHERATYIESITIFILILLAIISFFFAGYGMNLSTGNAAQFLTNLLLIFLIAEVAVIIMMLSRIYHK